jgi:uncharacterized Zn-finger protein
VAEILLVTENEPKKQVSGVARNHESARPNKALSCLTHKETLGHPRVSLLFLAVRVNYYVVMISL